MSGQRILVVDDSPFTGEAVAWALRGAGFVVDVARDMWDLERPDLVQPDLVLMDVVLQEAFGDDLAMLLRGVRGFVCPIVLLSSLPEHLLERRAADAELDGFIPKSAGLSGIVARARELLGKSPPEEDVAATQEGFQVGARQRVRRIVHIAASDKKWNTSAIVSEAHTLAGDADLAGANDIADAARALRDVAQRYGSAGATSEITRAIEELAELMPESRDCAGIVLLVAASAFCESELVPELDEEGWVIVEARSLVELRPKLHAADYDAVVVEEELRATEPTLLYEIRRATEAPIAILADETSSEAGATVLVRRGGADRVVEQIAKLAKRS
jgi:DNA-binding response OmpR family regulator